MKNITLEEARELYKQGAMAKEIALRAYPEEEILNDYSLITYLPKKNNLYNSRFICKIKNCI